jgi:hypothetical protein
MRLVLGSAHRRPGETLSARWDTQHSGVSSGSHFARSLEVLREINAENELALAYADSASTSARAAWPKLATI